MARQVTKGAGKLPFPDELGLEFADFQFNGHQRFERVMEQQQINKKLVAVHFQPIPTAHEDEHTAHGPEKTFNAGNERLL